jgi:hypothetical protein
MTGPSSDEIERVYQYLVSSTTTKDIRHREEDYPSDGLEQSRDRKAIKRCQEKKRAAHLCTQCQSPVCEGRTLCQEHRKKQNEAMRRYRERVAGSEDYRKKNAEACRRYRDRIAARAPLSPLYS